MQYPDIELEKSLWKKGFKYVVGIDEAGRGPLAGPVAAGAVVIENGKQVVEKVRDSKKMTEKQREEAFEKIKEISTAWGVGLVDSREIDRIGIQDAVKKAMIIALVQVEKKLGKKAEFLIVDGTNVMPIIGYKMKRIKHGDLDHYSISAASVLAKVERDRIMKEYAIKYPEYGFDRHVGYGTKLHMDMLKEYGPCDIHRRCFGPVKRVLNTK
jgi:ribonuclease HII